MDEIKEIIFQFLFIYAFLQNKLDNFSHGEYNINSFLIIQNNGSFNNIKLNLGEHIFLLEKPKYICKLFNYRKSEIGNIKNNNKILSDNPTYAVYTIFKSFFDKSEINKDNYENIKFIISKFIPIEIIKNNIMNESDFYNLFTDTIIPLQILIKNNFFSNFINMNFKHNSSSKNLSRGNINLKKNIELNKLNSELSEDSELSTKNIKLGYRQLSSNFKMSGGSKLKKTPKKTSKRSKKSSNKNLKENSELKIKNKNSKKNKKPSKKRSKLSRQNVVEDLEIDEDEEVEIEDDNQDDDQNDDEKEQEVENVDDFYEDEEELEDTVDEDEDEDEEIVEKIKEGKKKSKFSKKNHSISIQDENQNDELNVEGDTDNDKVPIDTEEMGIVNKKTKKKIIKKKIN